MKTLSLLSFPITQSRKELSIFTLSPSDGESDALLALLGSSNLLLSLQGVQQPCEDPSLDSSSNPELKEFFLCALWHLLNALLAECLESSVILTSVELTTEFLPNATHAFTQCPPGRALQNSSELLSSHCVLSHTVLPPRYSTTLRSSPELMTSTAMPS
jgi:hypothetical protein